MTNMESGFIFNRLILLESSFQRNEILSDAEKPDNSFDLNVEVATMEDGIAVSEEVKISQEINGVKQFDISVKMVGVFQRKGESSLTDDEEFGKINGAAIIFPFIREHVANIAMKGGLGAFLIPPVNFTAYNNDSKVEK